MKTEKQQVAGYGLHYHANNQLIPNVSDRALFQCLIDIVRKQLSKSLDDQTVFLSLSRLAKLSGLDAYRTVPSCLDRLDKLGLISRHNNAITVMCDEYVTIVQHYESLNGDAKMQFAKDFTCKGVGILQECRIPTILQCRQELIGMTGSSISVIDPCKNVGFSGTGTSKPYNNVGFSDSDAQNPTLLKETCKNVGFSTSEPQNPTFLQETCNFVGNLQKCRNTAIMQENLLALAKILHSCRGICNYEEFCEALDPTFLQGDALDFLNSAFLTGNLPESFKNDEKKSYIFAGVNPTFLQVLGSKILHFCSTVINIDKIKNKGPHTQKIEENDEEDEDYHESIRKGLERFGKIEAVELNSPSEFIKGYKGSRYDDDTEQLSDYEQKVIKRAGTTLRERNPYKNKPYFQLERIKEIVECLDETIKSPVDFFLYQFWWGIYDLYCEHYNPSVKFDEQGDEVIEPQSYNWKEMIDAPLPQDEVYAVAKNAYEDLEGAVQMGKYIYGEHGEWTVSFAFDSFEEFNPYYMFQWDPCVMKDKSIPALKVAIDRFYDIGAKDLFVPTRGDRKKKNFQNRKMLKNVLDAEPGSLTPMENALRSFYKAFVALGADLMVDYYYDGSGTPLEGLGRLPDHLLKPWCYSQPGIRYDDFTDMFAVQYKPIDGLAKRAGLFSAEKVVRWNEANGYFDTVAHRSLEG